ncbi:MAG: glycosyltransferase family 92 protein [Proteobacteria bacterium]|nr:glycosyltransferase family 92 protein [Pseudomonadota bacterium]
MTHRAVIFACARDETPYIAEWLAYHRAIGFGHVFLYCNDDDPGPLFAAVLPFLQGTDPFVTFHHYLPQGEQFRMYMDALARYRDAAEWIAFLDIDEFLALRAGGTLDDLLDEVPPNQGCLLLHWLMFGPNGHATPPPGGVPENYTRRAERPWVATKTITRSACIDLSRIDRRIYVWHGWEGTLAPGAASRSVVGLEREAMPADGHFLTDPAMIAAILGRAAVHHYTFRSEAALAQRVARGLGGDFRGQKMWQRVLESGTGPATMAELDAVEDRFLAEDWARRRTRGIAAGAVLPRPAWPDLAQGRPIGPGGQRAEPAAGGSDTRIAAAAPPSWQVDLGAAARVREIRVIQSLEGWYPAEPRQIDIDTSSDGRHWLRVGRAAAAPAGGPAIAPACFVAPVPIPARFVRLRPERAEAPPPERVEIYGASGGNGR